MDWGAVQMKGNACFRQGVCVIACVCLFVAKEANEHVACSIRPLNERIGAKTF